MNVLTVCSGIGAPEVAWRGLGWNYIAGADIEAFPNAVRAHHFPDVPNWGDMTKFQDWPDANIDILVGGTPCQSFSVAGLRKGLADPRGNLALTFLAIASKYAPRWILWENVPGVLSSEQGRDFGAFLGGLGQCGYGWAYRVLDAQHFGVPQRRRRVFVVGHLGDWRRAAAVLFERHSLSGHPAPRRAPRQGVADLAPNGPGSQSGSAGWTADGRPAAQAFGGGANCHPTDVATAVAAHPGGRYDIDCETFVAHSLRAEGFDASEDGTGRGTPLVPVAFAENSRAELRLCGGDGQTAAQLTTGGGKPGQGFPAVAYQTSGNCGAWETGDITGALDTNTDPNSHVLRQASAVRRLTPRECERLQGFPDDYTLVPYRGKLAADGPRYKALGNSMAVPVMSWIGERIAQVEALTEQRRAAA